MRIVDKQTVGETLALERLAQLCRVQEEIRLWENQYGKTLAEFAEQMENAEEDFEHYDDYIEWKAAVRWQTALKEEIEELRHGYFEVA